MLLTPDKKESLTGGRPVSVFIPSVGLGGGGAEQVVVYLIQSFEERGLQVDLVLLKAGGIFMDKVPCRVRVIDLAIDKNKPGLVVQKIFALMKYLRQEQPVALFAVSDTDNVALWAKLMTGASTQIIAVLQLPLSIPLRWMKNRLKHYFTRRSYRWVDGAIACSQGVAEDLATMTGRSPKDIKVVYNPVEIDDVLKKAEALVDHPWFDQDEYPVILGAGRLVKQKDFTTLIQAFSIVRQQRPAKLIIIGKGEQQNELEALIHQLGLTDDVDLAGFQVNPFPYMAKATIFALSSAFEGFGNVIVEAMAVGTPVVSTRCKSGPAEILEDGKYGKLVPIKEPALLAEAIIATIDNPIPPEILQQRARCFSLESTITGYLETVKTL